MSVTRFLRRRGLFVAWLTFVWIALWESVSPGVVLSGILIALVLVLAFPRPVPRPYTTFRPLHALRFGAYFAYKLVQANLVVAWEVITPRNRINQGVVAVPVRGASDAVVTIVANAISLTPGTLTIEVARNPTVLYVHVLHLKSVDTVREDVRKLETLALQAFAREVPDETVGGTV